MQTSEKALEKWTLDPSGNGKLVAKSRNKESVDPVFDKNAKKIFYMRMSGGNVEALPYWKAQDVLTKREGVETYKLEYLKSIKQGLEKQVNVDLIPVDSMIVDPELYEKVMRQEEAIKRDIGGQISKLQQQIDELEESGDTRTESQKAQEMETANVSPEVEQRINNLESKVDLIADNMSKILSALEQK
jgi:hypothetical protein